MQGQEPADQLLTFAQLCEAYWEQSYPVTMCVADLEKAYDQVPRHLLWELLKEYSVYGSIVCVIQSLHECSENSISILPILQWITSTMQRPLAHAMKYCKERMPLKMIKLKCLYIKKNARKSSKQQ